jgi:peptidoglycan/xylan/chitin deacetylase (PgdA/CDA1 family)
LRGYSRGGAHKGLRAWIEAGAELGNHSWSHPDLNTTRLAEYQKDILRAEPLIRRANGGRAVRFFRSPMLHTGADLATKQALERFLEERGYRQAPVTIDNSDWMFAAVYARAVDRGDGALARGVREAYVPYMESVTAYYEAVRSRWWAVSFRKCCCSTPTG